MATRQYIKAASDAGWINWSAHKWTVNKMSGRCFQESLVLTVTERKVICFVEPHCHTLDLSIGCYSSLLKINQHWFSQWLLFVRRQTIT